MLHYLDDTTGTVRDVRDGSRKPGALRSHIIWALNLLNRMYTQNPRAGSKHVHVPAQQVQAAELLEGSRTCT